MRKRLDVFWRVAVVLLVVMAIASIATSREAIQAAGPRTQTPNTYMDPIPERINGSFANVSAPYWISGTTLDGATGPGYNVTKVQVMIGRNIDGWCWNGTSKTWNATDELWNNVGLVSTALGYVVKDWSPDQWAWKFNATFNSPAGNLTSGWAYTVWARAVDVDGYWDPTPASDAFIYDNESPDVSFETNFIPCMYDLTEIKGKSWDVCGGDVTGDVQQVRLMIYDVNHNVYWNGYFWQGNSTWIKAQGTLSWHMSTTTTPPLPKWQNNTSYCVSAMASDRANNRAVAGPHQFTYQKQLLTYGSCYLDQLPACARNNSTTWAFMGTGFNGTAKAIPGKKIVNVSVKIFDDTDAVYWDNGSLSWAGSVGWANCSQNSSPIVLDPCGLNQYNWNVPLPTGSFGFLQGHIYKISAQARDNATINNTYNSSTESFTFDNISPGNSNIYPFYNIVYNEWNSLTGNCEDDAQGKIAAEVVLIHRVSDGLYWNGFTWGDKPWINPDAWDWIYAAANGGSFGLTHVEWKVTDTTEYPLPLMVHNESYNISAFSFDCAGNVESTATKNFTFRMDMHNYAAPTATATAGPTGTGGPTATSPATATSTVVPTGTTASATATATVPTATKTPTPTVTTVPGFSGSGTIGAGVGTVVAEDSNGDTRVTASFDANAFDSDTGVTISGAGNCGGIGAAPENYKFGVSCFNIGPAGDLSANVKVCVYYQPADGDPDDLTLAYKNSGGTWVILDTTVDKGAGTICAETKYIGTFAVLGKAAAEGGEWVWWYYLLIGLGALLVVAIIVLILIRPKGEGEGAAEEGYEEEEEI